VPLAEALGDAFDTVSDGLQALNHTQPTPSMRTDRQTGRNRDLPAASANDAPRRARKNS
jgi:hypothetical protein